MRESLSRVRQFGAAPIVHVQVSAVIVSHEPPWFTSGNTARAKCVAALQIDPRMDVTYASRGEPVAE
jgi:hypothetical protein